jgi:hypothetical protein
MRSSGYWLKRRTVDCLVILLAVPLGATAHAQAAATAPAQAQSAPQSSPAPDSQAGPQTSNPPAPQSSTPQPQQNGSAPVGTAAAPYEKGIGVAASRPAGAVIAPAKQRRTRSILIRVGLIVAAGVAIGTVVALSSASPSTAH